jgi:hypothetical protein
MATCSKCGATVADQKAFCQDCGAPMSPQAQSNATPSQPGLGATVIVPPSKWPTAPPSGAASSPQPAPQSAAAPQAARTHEAPAPTPPQPAPPVVPAPTPEKGRSGLVYVLLGAIVLLLIIIAFVLLRG